MPPAILRTQSVEPSLPNSARGIRKRVCKACDRCRLKKGKCDGANQCSRCKTDNAICVFGERRKSRERNYPKGYAEMLEQQQAQLVSALTQMYHQLQKASAWEGPSLDESEGHPSIHDILSALDLLEIDGKSNEVQVSEEECDRRQFKISLDNASLARRRLQVHDNSKVVGSFQERPGATISGDCESLQSELSSSTPNLDQPSVTAPLVSQSIISRWEETLQLQNARVSVAQHSNLHKTPAFTNNKRTRVSEWEHALVTMNETFQAYCDESKAFGAPDNLWDSAPAPLDLYQDFPINGSACDMPNVNDLFYLHWIPCDSSDFVWQPEMKTWATCNAKPDQIYD